MTEQRIEPTAFQAKVLAIPESCWIFMGGGRGGGKTHAILFLILRHCRQYGPLARILVTRRRLKSLQQFAEELRGLLRAAYGSAFNFNANDGVFRLNSGATIALTHCESASALQDTVQGQTFGLIVVDEIGEGPDLATVDQLSLTLRAKGVPLRMVLAGNPGGQNHAPCADRWVTGRTPWATFEFGGNTYVYAPSTVDDNDHLPDGYKKNFEVLKTTDPGLYKAHRYGDWSAITGSYFAGSWRHDEMVIDHHEVPPQMFSKLSLAIDWGSAAPCVTLLMGTLAYDVRLRDDRVLPKASVIVFDEHAEVDPLNMSRGTGRSPSQIAPAIHAMCARNGVRAKGVIDSAAEAKSAGTVEDSISDLFRAAGVKVRPARKGPRVPRFELLKTKMISGEFYVASRCKGWLRTVPSLPRDPRLPEDVDTKAVDHWLDACSYGLAGAAGGIKVGTFSGGEQRMPNTGDKVIWV